MSPLEFENLAGLHGRKWRENIKYERKPIGKWLSEQGCDPSSQKVVASTPDAQQPTTGLQGVDVENGDNEQANALTADESLTLETSTATSSVNDEMGVDTQNVSMSMTSNDHESMLTLSNVSKELESKLSDIVKSIVEKAISAFIKNIQKETQLLRNTISALAARVSDLEEKLDYTTSAVGRDKDDTILPESNPHPEQQASSNAFDHQQQLLSLQSQVQSLSEQQKSITVEKEREKRKCNLLSGNVEEKRSESVTQVVLQIFKEKLDVNFTPVSAMRLGKFSPGQSRLILI